MQAEVDRMVQAPPQEIFTRLQDNPGSDYEVPAGDADAALAHKESDMHRTQWLLSALYNMETTWDPQDKLSKPTAHPNFEKVLSLFESQGRFIQY